MDCRCLLAAALSAAFTLAPSTLASPAFQTKPKKSAPKSQQTPFSWDSLAEPGHTSADTLAVLKGQRRTGSLAITSDEPPAGPGTHGVTLVPPPWPIPPGAQGYNGTMSSAETGIVVNGTPMPESFSLVIPAGYNPSSPPPLVVAWHGYGTSSNQPMFQGLPFEANNRGWLLVAPLGVTDNSFSWIPGQIALDKVLAWLRLNYPYDESRVYGVGFSMGAMCITNYAARHQDPAATRFAALATVCGTFDNVDNYVQSPPTQALMQSLFGGSPFISPYTFEYERVHLLRLPTPLIPPYSPIDAETPGRSIAHLPIFMTWSADDNVVPYSPIHNTSLLTYLLSLGNTPSAFPKVGLPNKHSWDVLNLVQCFDFFQAQSLDPHPTDFSVLTDKGGNFNDVKIVGGTPGVFRRFDVSIDNSSSTIHLTNSSNLDALRVTISSFALSSGDLLVHTNSLDATTDQVQLVNATNLEPPSKIQIDSTDDYTWTFDLATISTTLNAPTGDHTTHVLYNTFDMTLGVSGAANLGATVSFDLAGGADGEGYGMLYSSPGTNYIPLSFVGDGDPRTLLLDVFTFNSLYGGTLSNGGQDHVNVVIPSDPFLQGSSFYLQAITAPGASAGIPFIIGRISNRYVLTIL